jgi:hypothetical protein
MPKLVFELNENKNKKECKTYPIACKVIYNADEERNSKIFKTRKMFNDVMDVDVDMEGGLGYKNSFRFKIRAVLDINDYMQMISNKLKKAIRLYNSKYPNKKIGNISVDIKIRKG